MPVRLSTRPGAQLGRSGAPYGQYLLDDALAGKVPAKLQFLLAAWALNPEERAQVKASRAPETTRVWCYAPGYIHPNRLDVSGIGEVTGFQARPASPGSAAVTPTEVGMAAGLTDGWGPKEAIQPLFTVTATPQETWATYADGSPAVVVRRTGKETDVFLGVPALTPELVRGLARVAGVHVFTEDNSAVWATEEYISIQAHKAGPVVINTGKPGAISDALSGNLLGEGPKLTVDFLQGQTRVFRY